MSATVFSKTLGEKKQQILYLISIRQCGNNHVHNIAQCLSSLHRDQTGDPFVVTGTQWGFVNENCVLMLCFLYVESVLDCGLAFLLVVVFLKVVGLVVFVVLWGRMTQLVGQA